MKPVRHYVTWKGGNGIYGRWHLVGGWHLESGAPYTVCGRQAPMDCQVAGEVRQQAKDTCQTCKDRQQRENRQQREKH